MITVYNVDKGSSSSAPSSTFTTSSFTSFLDRAYILTLVVGTGTTGPTNSNGIVWEKIGTDIPYTGNMGSGVFTAYLGYCTSPSTGTVTVGCTTSSPYLYNLDYAIGSNLTVNTWLANYSTTSVTSPNITTPSTSNLQDGYYSILWTDEVTATGSITPDSSYTPVTSNYKPLTFGILSSSFNSYSNNSSSQTFTTTLATTSIQKTLKLRHPEPTTKLKVYNRTGEFASTVTTSVILLTGPLPGCNSFGSNSDFQTGQYLTLLAIGAVPTEYMVVIGLIVASTVIVIYRCLRSSNNNGPLAFTPGTHRVYSICSSSIPTKLEDVNNIIGVDYV